MQDKRKGNSLRAFRKKLVGDPENWRRISNTTFGLIDLFSKDEEFRQTARKARATHDQTSQQIYRTVRTTNKALHILADTLIIGKAEKRLASRKRDKGQGSDDQ